ncbi:MAG: TetR/AcrR family transcriptional regulator [Clostridia bacterium]|nr:TetR/AcrR family transcriptional regulator [Clostridia bacterium]
MPKIIENVKEQLLAEAARQIRELGYSKTTIRSVAGACGVGVGTVYNYFPSKDMLIASFMLEDWQRALAKMRSVDGGKAEEIFLAVYDSLRGFITSYKTLFSDPEAAKSFGATHTDYHRILRRQIADIVLPVLSKTAENGEFAAEFIAESLLTWTMEGKAFGDIYSILESIIK